MSIPVAPEMEIVATAQAAALGEYLAMTRDKIDEVKLALVEACINAFEHADCRDEQLHLTFRLGQEPKGREWLEVEVLDKGKGFDRSTIERLGTSYAGLLAAVAADPELAIHELRYDDGADELAEAERRRASASGQRLKRARPDRIGNKNTGGAP